jgi:toxin-antitoxin system PIN domain toxin
LAEKRRYLLDLNVLIALADVDHVHRDAALRWFDNVRCGDEWSTCLLTEAGFIRVTANGRAGGYSVSKATGMLGLLTSHPEHRFWPVLDSWSSLSQPFADRIFGHQQVTDACLLGLAVREDGVLVTMDKAIAHLAGAKYSRNLLLLDLD